MAIVLALGSALVYGVSDYLGGRTSRRHSPLTLTLVAELTLVLIFLPTVPVFEDAALTGRALGWGIAGGAAGSLGVLGLYVGLSRGSMTVVAPITGVVAAVVPVIVGVAIGERPGPLSVVGIVVAIVAVGLIGGAVGATHQHADRGTIVLAVVVGGLFATMFIAFAQAGDDAGWWPLMWARVGGTPLLGGAFLVARARGAVAPITRPVVGPGIVVGTLVGLANGLYLLSTREGLLSIVAVIVSLYPASTIVLASTLDHERVNRSQSVGMIAAACAVGLITLGT